MLEALQAGPGWAVKPEIAQGWWPTAVASAVAGTRVIAPDPSHGDPRQMVTGASRFLSVWKPVEGEREPARVCSPTMVPCQQGHIRAPLPPPTPVIPLPAMEAVAFEGEREDSPALELKKDCPFTLFSEVCVCLCFFTLKFRQISHQNRILHPGLSEYLFEH